MHLGLCRRVAIKYRQRADLKPQIKRPLELYIFSARSYFAPTKREKNSQGLTAHFYFTRRDNSCVVCAEDDTARLLTLCRVDTQTFKKSVCTCCRLIRGVRSQGASEGTLAAIKFKIRQRLGFVTCCERASDWPPAAY